MIEIGTDLIHGVFGFQSSALGGSLSPSSLIFQQPETSHFVILLI